MKRYLPPFAIAVGAFMLVSAIVALLMIVAKTT